MNYQTYKSLTLIHGKKKWGMGHRRGFSLKECPCFCLWKVKAEDRIAVEEESFTAYTESPREAEGASVALSSMLRAL